MARFSIGGGEQGAGSSSRSQKRRRTDPQTPALSDGFSEDGGASRGEGSDTEDGRRGGGGEHGHGDSSGEDDEGWGNEEVEEGGSGEEEADDSDGEGGGGENDDEEVEEQRVELHRGVPAPEKSITFTLTDTDVLDCAICYEPLTSPIYQCENGHVTCSSCCVKMKNKCPSCAWPIGYNRCRALEKVLESVRLRCKFCNYGCVESISYHKRQDHEKSCLHIPCHCPLNHCSYIGTSKQVARHFDFDHPGSGTVFNFNTSKSICLRFDTKFHVLIEEMEESLFLLSNRIDHLGNKIAISCIGPSSKGDYLYDLMAKYERSCLKLQTFTRSIQEASCDPEVSPYLLIPKGFFGSSTTMKLEFLIRDYHTRI